MNLDITFCTGATEDGEECPIRKKCGRWVQRLSLPDMIARWEMYAPGRWVEDVPGEPPDWVCEYLIREDV